MLTCDEYERRHGLVCDMTVSLRAVCVKEKKRICVCVCVCVFVSLRVPGEMLLVHFTLVGLRETNAK